MRSIETKTALESNKTFAVVLNSIMLKQYGPEWIDWDPTTIYMELKEDFRVDPSSEVMDRLSAVQVTLGTGAFFDRLDAFLNVSNTLNSGEPSFAMFDPVTTEEIAWALTEVSLMRDLLKFDYGIRQYIKMALASDGFGEGDHPDVIKHVFETKDPSSNSIKDITQETLHDKQRDAIEVYINEQLKDIVYQFDRIPGLDGELDKLLSQKDMDDTLEEL